MICNLVITKITQAWSWSPTDFIWNEQKLWVLHTSLNQLFLQSSLGTNHIQSFKFSKSAELQLFVTQKVLFKKKQQARYFPIHPQQLNKFLSSLKTNYLWLKPSLNSLANCIVFPSGSWSTQKKMVETYALVHVVLVKKRSYSTFLTLNFFPLSTSELDSYSLMRKWVARYHC